MSAMLSVRTLLSELHAWEWLEILLARVAVGLLFFLSGRDKLLCLSVANRCAKH